MIKSDEICNLCQNTGIFKEKLIYESPKWGWVSTNKPQEVVCFCPYGAEIIKVRSARKILPNR